MRQREDGGAAGPSELLGAAVGICALSAAAHGAAALLAMPPLGADVPPAVAGLVTLTAALLCAPAHLRDAATRALAPAERMLDRFVGFIFVPYVTSLFAGGLPSGGELARAVAAAVVGWLLVAVGAGWAAAAAERLSSRGVPQPASDGGILRVTADDAASASSSSSGVAAIALLDRVCSLRSASLAGVACAAGGFAVGCPAVVVEVAAGLLATIAAYRLAERVPASLQRAGMFPTVTAGLVIGLGLAAARGTDAVIAYQAGTGAILLSLVPASIVSCALKVSANRRALARAAAPLAAGLLTAVPLGMAVGALLARAFGLSEPLALASLSKNITSGLAVVIAAKLEAPTALAAAACVISGTLGLSVLPPLLTALGIHSPAARGIASGGSSHGAGTAGLAALGERDASAFSAATFAIGGALAVALVSYPPFVLLLRSLAGLPA